MAKKKKAPRKKVIKNEKSMFIALDDCGDLVACCVGNHRDIQELLEGKFNDGDLDEDKQDEITVYKATKAFGIEVTRGEYDVSLQEREIKEEE